VSCLLVTHSKVLLEALLENRSQTGLLVDSKPFLYSQVFIWVIDSVPDAFRVKECDLTVFRTNADLLDNEPGATVKNCLT
jgi:hypothetical protein